MNCKFFCVVLCAAVTALAQETPPPATNPITDYGLGDVVRVGSGPIPMIIIPGYTCDASSFAEYAQRNSSKYTMHIVTLAGFGGTPAPKLPDISRGGTPWIDQAASGVMKMLFAEQIDKPIIMGHSLGGMIAMRLYEENPRLFRAAVCIDAMPLFPPLNTGETIEDRRRQVKLMRRNLEAMPEEEYRKAQRHSIMLLAADQTRAEQIVQTAARIPKNVSVHWLYEISSLDLRTAASRIKKPILLLAAVTPGNAPQMQSVRDIWRSVSGSIPGAELVLFEQTRHFIMYDRPEQMDAAIDKFIRELPPEEQAP